MKQDNKDEKGWCYGEVLLQPSRKGWFPAHLIDPNSTFPITDLSTDTPHHNVVQHKFGESSGISTTASGTHGNDSHGSPMSGSTGNGNGAPPVSSS